MGVEGGEIMLTTLRYILGHPISSKRPVAAVWRYANWQVRSRLQDDVLFRWIGGAKLLVRHGMTGATGNIYCGLHEFADMAFLLHLLRPGDVFVDVGANIGSFTVLAGKVCGARCISIEPDPVTAQRLRKNVSLNEIENLVRVHEVAVGAERGEVLFSIGLDTVNHVVKEGDGAARKVELLPLDDVVAAEMPTMLKMDVEGFEAEALLGASGVLKKQSLLAIEMETIDPEIVATLAKAGFERWYYEPFSRTMAKQPVSVAANNALFVRDVDTVRLRLASAERRIVAGIVL